MIPTARKKTIPFKEALHIFWDWRLASISIEVSFFGKSKSSETVRVSIDGLVTLVDPEGIVTVSGDGREIELDLRGCEFTRARETSAGPEIFNPLDPDSVLQVNFPNGEVCLVFPYRRVAHVPGSQRRAENGLEWLQNKLSSSSGKNGLRYAGLIGRPGCSPSPARNKRPRLGKRIRRVPVFPVASLLLAAGIVAFALIPVDLPTLVWEVGLGQASLSAPDAQVWVMRQVGNYYCHGGMLFGRQPGELMKQSEALTLGYQPALGQYCGGADSSAVNGRSHGVGAFLHNVAASGRLILSFVLTRSRSWFSRAAPQIAGPLADAAPAGEKSASQLAPRGVPSSRPAAPGPAVPSQTSVSVPPTRR